jgi:hypothetical protein
MEVALFTLPPFPQGSRFDLGQFFEVRFGGDFGAALGFEFAAGIASNGASGTGGLLVGGKTSGVLLLRNLGSPEGTGHHLSRTPPPRWWRLRRAW